MASLTQDATEREMLAGRRGLGRATGNWPPADLALDPWTQLAPAQRAAVEAEERSLALPGLEGRIVVRWLR